MNPDNRIEIVKLELWKQNQHFKIFVIYNLRNNIPTTDKLEIGKKTIVLGDLNAHAK